MNVGAAVGAGRGMLVGIAVGVFATIAVGTLVGVAEGALVGAEVAVGSSLAHAMSTADISRTTMKNGNIVFMA